MTEAESSFADLENLIAEFESTKKFISENKKLVEEIESRVDLMYESIVSRAEALMNAKMVLENEMIPQEAEYVIDFNAADLFSKIKAILRFESDLLLDRAESMYEDIPTYSPNGKNPSFATFKSKLKLYLENFGLETPKKFDDNFARVLSMSPVAARTYFNIIKDLIEKHFEIEKERYGIDLSNIWEWNNIVLEYNYNKKRMEELENKIRENPALMDYIIRKKNVPQVKKVGAVEEQDVFEKAMEFSSKLVNEYYESRGEVLTINPNALVMSTDWRRRQIEEVNVNREVHISFSRIKSEVEYGSMISGVLEVVPFGIALYLVKHGVSKDDAVKMYSSKYKGADVEKFSEFYDYIKENEDKFEILKE